MSRALVALVVAGVGALAAFGGYRYAMYRTTAAQPASTSQPAAGAERKPLYWYDPMFPEQKFDKPGKSPFMNMDLVPV